MTAIRDPKLAVAIVAVAIVGAVGLWQPPAAAAADIGFPGHSYSDSAVTAPSGEKPQSKLWFNDGTWWATLFQPSSGEHRIHRLDGVTQQWVDTGTAIDDRNDSKADTLWDGNYLYVASGSDSASGIKLFRYSYNAACRTWSLDTGFPVDLPGTGTRVEAVVLDRDASGRLWITYTKEGSGIEDGKVYVSHSTTSDNTWITPYGLPVPGASNIAPDDLSALVAYNGRIGVMWSNQNDSKMYFASHANGAGDAASDWTSRVVLEGDGWADDHINLKSLEADPSGRVFAAVKTSLGDNPFNGSNADQIVLLVLQPDATKDQVVPFGTVADDHTRPIVVTRQQTDELYVFATSPTVATDGDQTIYYKKTSLSNPSFAPGLGTAFIRRSGGDINNASSTKQDVSSAPGLVVLASDSSRYWHNTLPLGGNGSSNGTVPSPCPPSDITAPAPTLTQPADGARTNDTTPAFAGTGGTATGDSTQVSVKIYNGTTTSGSLAQTRTTTRNASTGAYSVDATTLTQGTYTAQAEQADDAGNTGTSNTRTFTIDTAPPSVSLMQPADGARTNDTTPTFAGTGGTATGDSTQVSVKIYNGGSATGSPVQTLAATRDSGSGAYTVNAAALAPGTFTAQAEQADDAGNSGQSAPRTFTIDTSAPAPTLTQPVDGARTNDTTPTFAGVGGTGTGDQAQVSVMVYTGATASGTPVQTLAATRDSGSGAYSVNAATLAPGTYTAQAEQADDAGNSGQSGARSFTVDTSAPAPTLTQPANGARTNDTTPTFAGTGGTGTGDASQVSVRIYTGDSVSGDPVQTLNTSRDPGSGAYSVNAASLADGTYTAQTEQQDVAGNSGQSAPRTFTIDTSAPAPTLTQPAANASTSDATPNLAGSGGTATGDSTQVSVKIYSGGSATGAPVQALTTTRDSSSGAYSVDAASLADGTYTVQTEQQDDAGNSGQSNARTFTIDTSAPAPAPTLTQPTAPVEPASVGTFSLVKARAFASSGRAILVLEVPGPGSVQVDVTARARKRPGARATRRMRVARLSRRVTKAGRLTLTIKPSRAARAILRRERTLRVRVKVTYSPLEGSKTSRTRALRLKLKKQVR